MYSEGKLSSGLGPQIVSGNRLEFYGLLSEPDFSAIAYTEEELKLEAQPCREIAARVKRTDIV
ncbi:UPF0175 family protein [Laspinema sp. D1]|uniref:UPF0175 family protein n=1 Tax=Laspinema palackyanum D2a TaxID=2953684 RepID=A0ABT2MNK9_9CYAN|nr:UPF0175 family protein [Laspinema sp. D2a]